jgi:hypothetical protein
MSQDTYTIRIKSNDIVVTYFWPRTKSRKKKSKIHEDIHEDSLEDCPSWWWRAKITSEKIKE